jgi:HlyD family secretion protein
MPRKRIIAIAVIIALAFGLLVSRRLQERNAEKALLENTKPPVTRVVGVHPSRQALKETFKATGSVAARAQVIVSPKVSGRIARMAVEEGAFVRAGQVLAEIDHVELSAQLAQSEASVASALAAISQGKINLISAETDERRMKELIDQAAISQQQFDQSVVRRQLAVQTINAAEAQLMQARATVRFNQAQLANYTVTAPISGQITARNVDGGAMAAAGVALFTLAQTGNLRAEFELPERQLAKLYRGQTVLVSSAAAPDRPVRAKLSEISPVVDPQSRLIKVRVDLPGGGVFRPGLSVDGHFVIVEKPSALAVPLEAVTMTDSQASVMLQVAGKVERRAVTTGIRTLERVEILSGLTAADTVIVAGQTFVKAGDPVDVAIDGAPASASDAVPAAGSDAIPAPGASAKGA